MNCSPDGGKWSRKGEGRQDQRVAMIFFSFNSIPLFPPESMYDAKKEREGV